MKLPITMKLASKSYGPPPAVRMTGRRDGPKTGMGTLIKWAREGGWPGDLRPRWPHVTGGENPKPRTDSPKNVEVFLNWVGLEARLNVFAGAVYLHGGDECREFDQTALNLLHYEASSHSFHIAKRTLNECVETLAAKKQYHPVQDLLLEFEKKHDGVARCETAFTDHLGAEDRRRPCAHLSAFDAEGPCAVVDARLCNPAGVGLCRKGV